MPSETGLICEPDARLTDGRGLVSLHGFALAQVVRPAVLLPGLLCFIPFVVFVVVVLCILLFLAVRL